MESWPLGDLRSWLDQVRKLGEVTDVDGADWNLEIGDLSKINYQLERPQALLFDKIKDYPAGMRVLTGSMSSPRRLGLSLRLGTEQTGATLVEALRGAPTRWTADSVKFEPRVVETGPVLENAIEGPDVNFLDYPVPFWNELDGGRFIGTGCVVMTSDPETGVVNAGAYRIQVQDEGRGSTIAIVRGKDGAQNVEAWFAKEGRAPVTVSFGHEPILLLVGGSEVPHGVSELAYAGAIAGARLDVVVADNGLPIPAHSEMAAVGWLHPDDLAAEGPFGEWTGYYSESAGDAYRLELTRLYHRDDPILLGTPPGLPPHDYSFMRCALKSAMVLDSLQSTGVPGVDTVWAHEAGGGRILLAVSINQKYAGHARQVALLVSQLPAGVYMNRYVVVVDDDIDVRRLDEVVWAICTRSDPAVDIDILRRTWGSDADPLLPLGAEPFMSRAVIDACIPFERRSSFPPTARANPERLAATRDKWSHLFAGH